MADLAVVAAPTPRDPPVAACAGSRKVPHGMCAPTAIARGLARCGKPLSPEQVQLDVTASTTPRAWHAAEFITAARRYGVVITIYRTGFDAQSIGAGTASETAQAPRIFLDMRRDGTHVSHYGDNIPDGLEMSRDPRQYVDVGTDGDGWMGSLKVLRNANASSGVRRTTSAPSIQCSCCGRVAAWASGCSPAFRDGGTGHLCVRRGGCLIAQRSEPPRVEGPTADGPPVDDCHQAMGDVIFLPPPPAPRDYEVIPAALGSSAARILGDGDRIASARPAPDRWPPGLHGSRVFCPALWSLGLRRAARGGTAPSDADCPYATPAAYTGLRTARPDLELPPWNDVLEQLDGIVPHEAELLPVGRHYAAQLQERWLGLSAEGALSAALSPLEVWIACETAPAAASTAGLERGGRGRGRGRGGRGRGRGRHASRVGAPPAANGAADADDPTPAPIEEIYGRCTGVIPPGIPRIKALMAALPCNLPGHVDGWMRKQGFHLQRILDAEPLADAGFATDAARWRYEIAVLGPKMEFELLRHRAAMADMKWAQGLGTSLPAVRALLPPLDEAAWSAWDGEALLAALRAAVDARPPPHRPASPSADDSICELFERGRIPAARAALYGEAVPPHAQPSEETRAELQMKNPRPEAPRDTVSEDEWRGAATDILGRCDGISADRRVAANDLLGAARMQRAGAAAGPDGWSGAYLRRLATLFPTEVAELLWREFRALSDTYDPLLACTITDATIGGIAKPRGGFRPIVIGRCAVRCLMAHLVKRARPALKTLLERGAQYALTGVLPAVTPVFLMLAKCAAAGVPWTLTDDDFENAFNTVSQRALLESVKRISPAAPELAACMLRAQCIIRDPGSAELVLRGRYPPGQREPLVVERYARGGGQGCPDMPAAFAGVIAMINEEAEAQMGDVRRDMSADEAAAVLWPLVRDQAGLDPSAPAPDAWREALARLMAGNRPDAGWGGPRGETSSAYADDAHSGGWAVACVIKSLRRIAVARNRATLRADPLKCKILTAAALKPDLDALLEPLRDGEARRWEVVTRMRVLGITLCDPTDRAEFEGAVMETLRVRVVAPVRRLIAEVAAGAKPATAYFALTRFVLPNALYHMQVWGLLCGEAVWAEVDEAFTQFCEAVCPLDQRARLADLRAELSLPQRCGGLGIPCVAREARLRAADQWAYRDATEAGMLREHAAAAYHRPAGALDATQWVPIGMDAHFKGVAEALGDGETRESTQRRDRNQLRSALWAYAAVPWVPELTLDALEWDVMWRLTFGGITPDMRNRLDRPADGFTFRGRRMEYAVMEAVEECLPPGVVRVSSQPAPERFPPDHEARCARDGCSPDGWKRADVALEFVTGKTVVLDVRTTNVLCASAIAASSPAAHLKGLERAKSAKYADYYRAFKPFVIDLSGAVSETSYGALKLIAEAAKASLPRLDWEAFDWAVRMQRRIAVAMVRCTAWIATRAPARVVVPGCRAGLGRTGSAGAQEARAAPAPPSG